MNSTRPWQHVLDAIGAYIYLAYILNKKNSVIGRVDAIHVENGLLFGGADKRGDDKSVGY